MTESAFEGSEFRRILQNHLLLERDPKGVLAFPFFRHRQLRRNVPPGP